jgi:histidine ammonia-lyase
LFLPLIGLGQVSYQGARYRAQDVLKKFSLQPIQLGPKEGLALINGTQFILAFAVTAVQRMHNCLEAADIIGAMSLEALTGTKAPFDARLHELRPFAGNKLVAQRLRFFAERFSDHAKPYRLRKSTGPLFPTLHAAGARCKPQCMASFKGVDRNGIECGYRQPVIFSSDDTISGGNFHGQSLALHSIMLVLPLRK